jgi:hypothetical protein
MADLSLVYAFADGKSRVDIETVLMVARDREQGGLMVFPRSLARLGRERIIAETSSMLAALQAEKAATATANGNGHGNGNGNGHGNGTAKTGAQSEAPTEVVAVSRAAPTPAPVKPAP